MWRLSMAVRESLSVSTPSPSKFRTSGSSICSIFSCRVMAASLFSTAAVSSASYVVRPTAMRRTIRAGINPLVFPGLELAVSQEESVAINENQTPKIIISASGMCDAGRVRHHLKHNLWRPESMVLFVGYQAIGTLGRTLVDGARSVKLFNETIQVEAEIDTLPGISGHADKNGLITWLQGFREKPKFVFVNHGDADAAEAFSNCLNREMGYRAFAPYSGATFDLLEERWTSFPEGVPVRRDTPAAAKKVNPVLAELIEAAERLLEICRGLDGRANRDLRNYTEAIRKLITKIEK